jgi:tRNA(His) guanylyltransferase
VQKRRVVRPFTTEEISKLPPKHAARTNPELTVERWVIQALDMPPFHTVLNRPDVIFNGREPHRTAEISPLVMSVDP